MPELETARIILVDPHQNVLVVQRPFDAKSRAGQLDFLGGKVDDGELCFDAAMRETGEEGGVELDDVAVEHILSWPDHDGHMEIGRHYYMAQVESFPEEFSSEQIGAAVLPAVVAYDAMAAFLPHQIALDMALGRLSVA